MGSPFSYHEFAEHRSSLVARIGGSADAAPLCFTGHIDTVPLGAAPWTVDPFAGEISDGKLYGRGTTDMKSGVAAFVVAVLRLARGTLERPRRGPGHYRRRGDRVRRGLSLGRTRRPCSAKAGAIVVAEPSSNQPWIGHKGALWLTARTIGVTAHGSMPEQGENAVYKAAHAISKTRGF